jgi:glutathione S-transferase
MNDGDFYHRKEERPTEKEWETRQREEIVKRWRQLARDLGSLSKDGVLRSEMTIAEAIQTLNVLSIEDVR